MSNLSHIGVIDRYHEYRSAIREVLSSIAVGITERKLLEDEAELRRAMHWMARHYPFADMLYTLGPEGIQTSSNIRRCGTRDPCARGTDRSRRPYFIAARDSDAAVITEPYLSSFSHKLCISAALRLSADDGTPLGYVVLDIDLKETVEFLMGDTQRRHFQPLFKGVYSVIVVGLFTVVAILMSSAFAEVFALLRSPTTEALHLKPFGVIIFLTLALAIFDLGKTTLEEEVLMHKDIFRHSSTRRTITRFIAAILIAVSIESLLLMFKSVLGDGAQLWRAVAMMGAAVGLLVGLGVYVYLGARAEALLLDARSPWTQAGPR